MIQCPKCLAMNTDDSNFCQTCGYDLREYIYQINLQKSQQQKTHFLDGIFKGKELDELRREVEGLRRENESLKAKLTDLGYTEKVQANARIQKQNEEIEANNQVILRLRTEISELAEKNEKEEKRLKTALNKLNKS